MNQVLSQTEVDALLSAVSDNRVDSDEMGGDDSMKSGVATRPIGVARQVARTDFFRHEMNDKNDIKVSVIIPAYNAADFIVDALQSILTQTVQPIEVVVVNDGSRDGTSELTRQWAAERQLDFKLIVVDQENKGLPASRNVGIGQSSGNWIALLDADDIWESTHLEELISALKSVPDAVASYGAGHLLVDGVLAETLYDDFWDNPSKKIGKPVAGE